MQKEGNRIRLGSHTLAEMRRDNIDLHILADEAHARRLIPVDAAEAGTKITFTQMGVRQRAFLSRIDLCKQLVTGSVVIQQEGRCEMEPPALQLLDPRRKTEEESSHSTAIAGGCGQRPHPAT